MALRRRITTVKDLSRLIDLRHQIKRDIINGELIENLPNKYNISWHFLIHNLVHAIGPSHDTKGEFGYKKADDFLSEEEMLNTIEYNYENLSYGEKEIYHEREKDGSLGKYFTSNDGLYGGHQGDISEGI